MPGYKHPCPYCSKFIQSDSAACPFCGVTEPFTHGRCPVCRAPLQPGWIACPKCGRSLIAADTASPDPAAPAPTPAPTSPAAPAPTPPPADRPAVDPGLKPDAAPAPPAPATGVGRCSGCGAALPAGARFCTECGTLVG